MVQICTCGYNLTYFYINLISNVFLIENDKQFTVRSNHTSLLVWRSEFKHMCKYKEEFVNVRLLFDRV